MGRDPYLAGTDDALPSSMSPRILVVYFTRTGHTKQVASSIAAALDADTEEISDPTMRSGVLGYLRSGFEAALRRHAPIGASVHNPAQYDLVIVGTPVWNMSVSSPVRSYLHRHRSELRSVAFFCTCGGRGGARAFAQMAQVCGADPASTLVVREAYVERSAAEVARFAADLRAALANKSAMPLSPVPLRTMGPAATKP